MKLIYFIRFAKFVGTLYSLHHWETVPDNYCNEVWNEVPDGQWIITQSAPTHSWSQ